MSLATETAQVDRGLERKSPDSAAKESPVQNSSLHPLGGVLTALGADGSSDGNSSLAKNPVLQRSGNGTMRALVMRRMQQGVGNYKAHQFVAQLHPSAFIQRECSCGGSCSACQEKAGQESIEEEEPSTIQRQAATATVEPPEDAGIPPDSPGQPLDPQTRNYMEPRFGHDFSDVRVHTDSSAAQSADALGANAYTTGRDIYFAAGKYAPRNREGRKLIAHELVHTVQQKGGASSSFLNAGKPVRDSGPLAGRAKSSPSEAHGGMENGSQALSRTLDPSSIASPTRGPHVQRAETLQNVIHTKELQEGDAVSISHPGDPLEREAEDISAHVLRDDATASLPVSSVPHEIARQEATPQDPAIDQASTDTNAQAPPSPEPFEGAKKLADRSSEVDVEISSAIKKWTDAISAQDLPWDQIIGLKLDVARVRREKLLVDTYFGNAFLGGKLEEPVDEVLTKCKKAAYDEEQTIELVEGVPAPPGMVSDIASYLLLELPDLFPQHVVGLYRSAVEEFLNRSLAEKARAEGYLTPLLSRPPEQIIPDYVWMIENEYTLQELALEVGVISHLDADTPVLLEKKQPDCTKLGIDDIRLQVNEQQMNLSRLLNPVLGRQLDFLYPILEAYYFWQFYEGLAQQMHLFQIAVEGAYERLNEPFSSPDVIKDLKRTYSNTTAFGHNALGHSWASQMGADQMRQGYWWISGKFAEVLDAWVTGLWWPNRIWQGFGLYDVAGEMGRTLKGMISLDAIAKMVGFIALMIAIQYVPFGNIVADAIMFAMLGADVLEGLVILGEYFDAASDATTFRGLYGAAQQLKGAGQVAVSLLLQLTMLAAGKGLGAYLKYRRGLKIKDINEIADDPALKEGPPAVQKALADAKSSTNAFSKWKGKLSPDSQAFLDDPANTGIRKMWAEMDPIVRDILTKCASDCIPRNATEAQAAQIKTIVDRFGIGGGPTEVLLKDYFHARRDVLQAAIDEVNTAPSLEDLEAFARQNPVVPSGTPAGFAARINALSAKFTLKIEEAAMLREYFQLRTADLESALSALEKTTAKAQLLKQLREAAAGRAPAAAGTPRLPGGRGAQYEHAINEHGAGESPEHMGSRSRTKPVYEGGRRVGVGQPIGQWYNNDLIVEADQRFPGAPGEAVDVNFGRPIGRVFLPDGLVVSDVTWVRIIRNLDGSFKNAFPILPPGVQY